MVTVEEVVDGGITAAKAPRSFQGVHLEMGIESLFLTHRSSTLEEVVASVVPSLLLATGALEQEALGRAVSHHLGGLLGGQTSQLPIDPLSPTLLDPGVEASLLN